MNFLKGVMGGSGGGQPAGADAAVGGGGSGGALGGMLGGMAKSIGLDPKSKCCMRRSDDRVVVVEMVVGALVACLVVWQRA